MAFIRSLPVRRAVVVSDGGALPFLSRVALLLLLAFPPGVLDVSVVRQNATRGGFSVVERRPFVLLILRTDP